MVHQIVISFMLAVFVLSTSTKACNRQAPTEFSIDDHLLVLGGKDVNYNTLSDVEVLGIQTECNPTDLSSPVEWHASVYSSDVQSLVTCGGLENYEIYSSCSVQSKNGHQIALPPMNSARSYFAMVAIQDQLISIGGNGVSNTMEIIQLNISNDEWIQQSMPFSVWSHCAVTLDNDIFVIGGKDENRNDLATTWIYNVVKKDWSQGPKLNEKRHYHACLVDEETNTIHAMGGYRNGLLKSTEKWTLGTNSWVSGANLPKALGYSAAVNSNSTNTIGYLVGGVTGDGQSPETFERHSRVWALTRRDLGWIEHGSKRLKLPRSGHTLVNIPEDQIPGC